MQQSLSADGMFYHKYIDLKAGISRSKTLAHMHRKIQRVYFRHTAKNICRKNVQ